MKLKYNFVVRNVAGQTVALVVEKSNCNFNGMIKLNSVGEFIFKLLQNEISEEDLVIEITKQYDVDFDNAKNSLAPYLETLRNNNLITE